MELRVLQYFLAVAREQNISAAAQSLHLSQPTLSRQLKDLEDELNKQLFIRGNRKITLTEEGMLLRRRAEEIIGLVHKTENEITSSGDVITGDIYIGAGETDAIRLVARAAQSLQAEYPRIHYHISSGDAADVIEHLDQGLIDFGVLLDPANLSKYDSLRLPVKDVWGVLMRKGSPLSERASIRPEDLWDKPIIISRQAMKGNILPQWLQQDESRLNIVATYSLLYNGSLMVDEGLGYALCIDRIINTTGSSALCFRPLSPKLEIGVNIVWKKYRMFSQAGTKFLEKLREML